MDGADARLRDRMVSRVREEGLRIGKRLGDPAWTARDQGARILEMRPARAVPLARGGSNRKTNG